MSLQEQPAIHPDIALGRARREILFLHLCAVAADGRPMPCNTDLLKVTGARYNKMTPMLGHLQQDGLIKIEYSPDGKRRRVTICATGQRTDWQAPQGGGRQSTGAPKKKRIRRRIEVAPHAEPPKPRTTGVSAKPLPVLASRGLSDFAIYGHLADAVRACRRAGDVVYRNERRPMEILINGRPGDVKARAAWHARMTARPVRRSVTVYAP